MSKWRLLRLLCSLFLVVSLLCGVAFGAEIPDLDSLGIDPWGDYEKVVDGIPTSDNILTISEEDLVYEQDPDVGIMPMALEPIETIGFGLVRFYGFGADCIDGDGDDFFLSLKSQGVSYGSYRAGSLTEIFLDGGVDYKKPFNQRSTWVGRPAWISGDPDISVTTKAISTINGSLGISFSELSSESAVSGYQFSNLSFCISPILTVADLWVGDSYSSTSYSGIGGISFVPNKVELYLNGVKTSDLAASFSITSYSNFGQPLYRIDLENASVTFPATVVESFEIRISYSSRAVSGLNRSSNGGFSYYIETAGNGVLYSGSAKIYQDLDTNSENTGLLKSIIQFLQNIVNGISNIASAIAQLPGKIVNLIIEGIKSLFIPTEDDLTQLKLDYQTLMETKFGFIYQCFQLLENFFTTMVGGWGSATDYSFQFPGISFEMQGQSMTLVQPQLVSLDNALMDVLRPVAGTVVSFICVLAMVHSMETMFVAIVSGKNYFDYLHRVENVDDGGYGDV